MTDHTAPNAIIIMTDDERGEIPAITDDYRKWMIVETELPMNWYVFEPHYPVSTPVEENHLILTRTRNDHLEYVALY